MRSFPVRLASVSMVAFALSCSGGRGADGTDGTDGEDGSDGSACTVSQTSSGAVITCADGTTATVPNGSLGTPGKNGADGEDGATGNDGTDGLNGQSALITLADEPAGLNCPYGGTKVMVGNDVNANRLLDAAETTSTRYVCNGQAGVDGTVGKTSLFSTSPEPAGSNCPEGGMRVDVGVDDDANGTLSTLELEQTTYLCQAQCVLENAKLTLVAASTGSLDYATNTNFDGNYLLSSTSATGDVVGWMGFDLSGLTSKHAVLGTRLYLRHLSQAGSPAGDPQLRVVHGPATAFTRTDLTTTNMPRGTFVSEQISSVATDAWTEIRLNIDSSLLDADRLAGRLSLGLDEVSVPTNAIQFYGSDVPVTRPYLEVETVRCATPD